ncbi:hypothetical protein [Candidatus Methylobacter oryzae]|uniref:DUF4760 domain-containing protein n=1 Tax=Candidatus Methylobacter oryzae TaxID=2497749 RepID=A0ABY3C714_9GAMM|nr:hypothetical protein [Candidatus Methylobacter oryzae]TRW91223.1 hypothetical protein EKO24_017570 [Candidatus Methylobacter oryzae]
MSKNSKFYKYFFIALLKKYIPINRPTKTNTLRYLILFCILLSISVFSFSYFSNWYKNTGVIDGLITELHGIIVELFVLTILLDWILKIREELRFKEPRAFAYAKAYSAIDNCLDALVDEYRSKGEKQYVYFSGNMEISRKLDIIYCLNPTLSNIEEIIIKTQGHNYFLENYINKVIIFKENLSLILTNYLYLMEPEIIHNIQTILEKASNVTEKSNEQTKNDFNMEVAREFMKNSESLIYYLFKAKSSLEAVADIIQTRAEHSAAMKIEREKWRKKYEELH